MIENGGGVWYDRKKRTLDGEKDPRKGGPMAINKAMRAALAALSYPELNVKKMYPLERELVKLTARRRRNPDLYRVWEHKVSCSDRDIPPLLPRRRLGDREHRQL